METEPIPSERNDQRKQPDCSIEETSIPISSPNTANGSGTDQIDCQFDNLQVGIYSMRSKHSMSQMNSKRQTMKSPTSVTPKNAALQPGVTIYDNFVKASPGIVMRSNCTDSSFTGVKDERNEKLQIIKQSQNQPLNPCFTPLNLNGIPQT